MTRSGILSICLIQVLALIFVVSSPAYGGSQSNPAALSSQLRNYKSCWISGGSASSWAIGMRGNRFGFSFGGAGSADYSEEDLREDGVLHASYTEIGRKSLSSDLGFDVMVYANPLKWMSIYGGAGYFQRKQAELIVSDHTGGLYARDGIKLSGKGSYSFGLQLLPSKRYVLGLEHHSIRGISINLGKKF